MVLGIPSVKVLAEVSDCLLCSSFVLHSQIASIHIQMTLHIILPVADQAASTFTPQHER